MFCYFKENAQLVQKVTAETLMGFKKKQQQQQQKLKVGNIVKAPKLLKRTITFLINIFMRQTLTNDFLGLHKNMNCAFPLKIN